jgi:mRNA interferase RelE/StbE
MLRLRLDYNIQYDPKAIKQLQKLNKQIASVLLDDIEEYFQNPITTKVKKLKTPFDGAYRLRLGDYRVVFYEEDELILISRVAHRKEVYI